MNHKTHILSYIRCIFALSVAGLFFTPVASAEDLKALEDCESCHTDQANEFTSSVHYTNRSGVQAACNNCHNGMQHKDGINTSSEVNRSRMDMAMNEWKRMKANDSKECKTCHSHMAMDLAKQEPRSVDRHEEAFDDDETSCIACHKGISHQLPHGWKTIAQRAGLQK